MQLLTLMNGMSSGGNGHILDNF